MSCLRIGSGTVYCPTPSRIVQFLSSLCVRCHSIVGLGLCLCGRVVSLWNSGDDLCGAEGRVVSTVHCQLCVLLWRVFQGGVRVVLLCCVVGCGMAAGGGCEGVWSRCLFSSSLCLPLSLPLVLVFGVVRAQLCEHARYPRTPLCLRPVVPLLFSSLCAPSFFSSLLLSAFLLLEWRWVIHHVSVCLVGMTAMGSLSRSSSFF